MGGNRTPAVDHSSPRSSAVCTPLCPPSAPTALPSVSWAPIAPHYIPHLLKFKLVSFICHQEPQLLQKGTGCKTGDTLALGGQGRGRQMWGWRQQRSAAVEPWESRKCVSEPEETEDGKALTCCLCVGHQTFPEPFHGPGIPPDAEDPVKGKQTKSLASWDSYSS